MHPARLKPLSKEELNSGMPAEEVEKYLSLVEQMYNAFFSDVNSERALTREEYDKKWLNCVLTYNSLIGFLTMQNAISGKVYYKLLESVSIEYNYIEHPYMHKKFVGDSLDDFRLAFEYSIVECYDNVYLCHDYLDERYGYRVCVRPNTLNNRENNKDLCVIRFEGSYPNIHSVQVSYWEVRQLLKSIRCDMDKNTADQKLLDKIIYDSDSNSSSHRYLNFLQKTIYGRPKNIAEWYTMKRALEREAGLLWEVENMICGIFECMEKPTDGVGSGATLYIYKGKIMCHRHNHPLVSATAIIHDEQDREVELDVEYCSICKRYMINHTSYEQYRQRYGLLIGKLKMISSNSAGGEFEMASESPLKLCGYNVSQTEGLSATARKFLLAKIIHDKIMTKLDVIHYLEHFINMLGVKPENALALEKWRDDLDFVHKYNKNIQPKVYIEKMTKY